MEDATLWLANFSMFVLALAMAGAALFGLIAALAFLVALPVRAVALVLEWLRD